MKRHPVALAAVLSALYAALPLAVYALRFGVVAPIYLFAGDAFYYLDIAKRSQRVPGFTFDGEHLTNGFHPLWEWLLYGLGRVGVLDFRQTEGVLLRVYWVNLLLLAAGAALFAAGVTRLLRHQRLGVLAVVPGLCSVLLTLPSTLGFPIWQYLNGMESALALFWFGLAFWLFRKNGVGGGRAVLLGVALGLSVLSRLDDVFLALPLVALACFQAKDRWRRQLVLTGGPVAVLVGGYLLSNWTTMHVLLPLSGAAKASLAVGWNGRWALSLLLPVVTGDGPSALMPAQAGYYGFGERAWRLLQMLVPAGIAAVELGWSYRRWRGGQQVQSVVVALSIGVMLKAAYNFCFVQIWNQGDWYYAVSLAVANCVLVLWLDRGWGRLRAQVAPHRTGGWGLAVHAVWVLFAFNAYISLRNYTGPADRVRFLHDSTAFKAKLAAEGQGGFVELDDGLTSYVTETHALAGLGLALDPEASRAMKEGRFLELAYRRGYRLLVARGTYAQTVDAVLPTLHSGRPLPLLGFQNREFQQISLVPLGGDGASDGLSFYRLRPAE